MRLLVALVAVTVCVQAAVSTSDDALDNISLEDDEQALQNNTKLSDLDVLSEVEEAKKSIYPKTEVEKKALLKRVLSAALRRPGAWTRLGQVLPIVRIMSAPQRLALASLVMAQVLAGPGDPGVPPIAKESSRNLTSQLMLPISMDIATMFRGLAREEPTGRSSAPYMPEVYPGGGKRIRPNGPNIRRPPPTLPGINRRNANIHHIDMSTPPRRVRPPVRPLVTPPPLSAHGNEENCDPLISSFCLHVHEYPVDKITTSLENSSNKAAFTSVLTDSSQNNDPEKVVMERRLGDNDNDASKGLMCNSKVEMVRPKRARATSGKWKYIVNTGDYTQTLRIELCTKVNSPCMYLSEDIDSQCVQVYNYHRLLTWDEGSGLTMDIFKVPTCCSCHVHGYGGIPFKKNESTSKTPPADFPDSNFVADESAPVRVNPPKGVRVRPYNPPKRESTGVRRPPLVQHRGPPLPLENEPQHDTRYPPYDNHVRRTTRNNTADRSKYNMVGMSGGPNQRHPALPADVSRYGPAQGGSTTRSRPPPPPPPPTSTPKKVNYSYHPIIDFFRPPTAESRMSLDWTPIIDQPRALGS